MDQILNRGAGNSNDIIRSINYVDCIQRGKKYYEPKNVNVKSCLRSVDSFLDVSKLIRKPKPCEGK